MREFTDEQKELMEKPVITVLPAFNNEWVIEVHSLEGELQGRFNAEDAEVAVHAIQVALTDKKDPPPFDIN